LPQSNDGAGVWALTLINSRAFLWTFVDFELVQILMKVDESFRYRAVISCQLTCSSHVTLVLVWPGHESRENCDVNSRFPTLMDSCSRLTRTWELRKLSCKLSLFNSHQLSCNSCSRLTGAWKSIKLSCKFSLLNSHQLVFLFDHGLTFETLVKRGCMKVVENRPYRLFTFHPMASFSCQILTHVLCLVGLKITFVIEPKNSKKQIRPGKHGNIIFICPWHAKIS
jgi:hypothetical protein